uniref:EamA domain-containing protein n=1 Tax=Leersia perrieri TaxID=77586 RepID=A0A0D9WH34_9ORYZ
MVLRLMEAKGKDAWGLLLVLLLGQLVAFSMALSSFTSSLIATLGVDAPLTQSFFAYFLLTLVYVPILLHRRQKLKIPWYWYLALAFIDVQGNYLVVKAYQYSYITSVTLLDCWTVVWVIVLTWYALGTRYSFWQFVGAGTCVAGLGLVLLSDSKSTEAQDASKIPLLGDALVIAGTVFFAFSNVGEEYCVKKKDRVEVVAMLGLFGLLVSIIQMYPLHKPQFTTGYIIIIYFLLLIFERKNLDAVAWSPKMICLFAGFAVAIFMFYTITPFVLKMSGSTLFNLSLLTSDMWAVAIRVLFYHQQINWLYYIAFAVVAIGLIIYSLNDHSSDNGATAITEAAAQYQQLPGEAGNVSNDIQGRTQQEEAHGDQERAKEDDVPSLTRELMHQLHSHSFRIYCWPQFTGQFSCIDNKSYLYHGIGTLPWSSLMFREIGLVAIKAYHYSYITSVNLLNCSTNPWVMILTRFALGTRYSLWQFVGAGTCMAGLALEYCVKNKDRMEFVAMLGIFGMLIGLFIGFAVASLAFSTITPFVLKVNWLYYVAFAVVAIGLVVYTMNESSDGDKAESMMGTETEYEQLPGEHQEDHSC